MTCDHTCLSCAQPTRTLLMLQTVAKVAAYFEMPLERITNIDFRDRETGDARSLAAYLLLEEFPRSRLEHISKVLGYIERSGASHAATRIEQRLTTDTQTRRELGELRRMVMA